MLHKCEGCKYKSEHQEMGFKAVGVCTKEPFLTNAVKAYNDTYCRFSIPTKAETIEEMRTHTEMQDAINEYADVLKKAAQGALNAYTTHLSFGGKPDQREEEWIEALFCGMQHVSLVEELRKQLEHVEMERDAAVEDLKLYAGCKVCKHGDFKFPKECMDCGDETNYWEWRGPCHENTKEEEK